MTRYSDQSVPITKGANPFCWYFYILNKCSRSNALRWNGFLDALRPVVQKYDAKRRSLHSHAEAWEREITNF